MTGIEEIKPVKQRPVPQVVEVLEEALEEARQGRLRNVAIVAEAASGDLHYTSWGLENNSLLIGLLERVKHRILRGMDEGCACGDDR